MSIQSILLIIAIIVVFVAIKRFKSLPPADAKKFLIKAAIYSLAGIFILAAVTGRVHWLMGMLAALVPFAQRLWGILNAVQWVKRIIPNQSGDASPSTGQTSEVDTKFLSMRLDHDSGQMTGKIIQGPHQGKSLEELNLKALRSLYDYYLEQDSDSAKLIGSYLNQYHPGWQSHEAQVAANGDMSLDEAYEILDLQPPVDVDTVRQAHRRLMQRLHPDRGGSSYLASQINRAKDLIMEQLTQTS